MRFAIAAALLAVAAACGRRQVEVRTAPVAPSQLSVQVTNGLSQAVNVYSTSGGTDTFLRQVRANTVETVPVQGFTAGTSVGLKAVTIDGVHTYTRSNVVLNGTYPFPVP